MLANNVFKCSKGTLLSIRCIQIPIEHDTKLYHTGNENKRTRNEYQNIHTTQTNAKISNSKAFLAPSCSLKSTRNFTTSNNLHNDRDNELNNKQKITTKIIQVKNPFKYIAMKVKIFLMRAYFDHEFSEGEFIEGAKQAVCFVTGEISSGKLSALNDMLTQEGLQCGRQLYHKNADDVESIRVDHDDFVNISMSDIGFEYDEDGRKWAYVLVVCFCKAKNSVSKTFGNIDVIATPTRLLRYSFRREYTPGISSTWFIDKIEHLVSPI